MIVRVPATIANLGPGFDALGLAVRIHNVVDVEPADRTTVAVEGEGAAVLPRDERNLVVRAAQAVAEQAGLDLPPLRITQQNAIPLRRGLGSSAAAIVGGVVAANRLLGDPLSVDALLAIAARLEGHPDNVTPALLGGFTVSVLDGDAVRWARVPVAAPIRIVLAIPEVEVATAEARRVLPPTVRFEDAAFNVGRAALLVAALSTGRLDLLPTATEDRLHQVYRSALVPGINAALGAARDAGALGVVLSGSGPTVAAFAADPHGVGAVMRAAFEAEGVACTIEVTEVETRGASDDS